MGSDRFLDLYKLSVEMADRISGRRATANAFFLTLNSALLAIVGLVHIHEPGSTPAVLSTDRFGAIVLSIAGLVLSLTWWLLLRSYRELNRAKFLVINTMELELPAQPFADEWKHLASHEKPTWWKRYLELGTVERVVPIVYAAIYVASSLRAFLS